MKQLLKAVCISIVLCVCFAYYAHATSGNISLSAIAATIETGSTQYVATLDGTNATITNIGSVDIEIGWNGQNISTAGVQGIGQFTLKVGMTVPVNMMTSFSFKSDSAGLIVYMPYRG